MLQEQLSQKGLKEFRERGRERERREKRERRGERERERGGDRYLRRLAEGVGFKLHLEESGTAFLARESINKIIELTGKCLPQGYTAGI